MNNKQNTYGPVFETISVDIPIFSPRRRTHPLAENRRVKFSPVTVASGGDDRKVKREPPLANDRLIDVPEAAARLGVSERYVYDHHHEWTFTRRIGRKLRFSEQGLNKRIGTGS